MPLENDKPDILPSDFNLLWPLARDLLSRGDDHLRLIKKAAANLQTLTEKEVALLQSYFDLTHRPVAAKLALKALEADTITGVQLDKFALQDGDYEKLRARATTAEDVGLEKVENFGVANSLTDSEELYIRASLLNFLYAQLQEEIRKRQPPDYSQFARKVGTYEHLRARGTTKEDVGLQNIEDYPLSQKLEDDDQKYGSARAVYIAYQDVLRKVQAGATSVAQASGIDTDNKSLLMAFSTAGREYTYRTLKLSTPFDEIIWKIPALSVSMNSASSSGNLKVEVWLEDTHGIISEKAVVEASYTGAENVGHIFGTVGLVGKSKSPHTVEIKVKATGPTNVSAFLSLGQGHGSQTGIYQFSAPSKLLQIS